MFEEEKVTQMQMDLIPLDEDLLSLELPTDFANHMLQDDDTYKVYVEYSIDTLESTYGAIPNKFALGKTSQTII